MPSLGGSRQRKPSTISRVKLVAAPGHEGKRWLIGVAWALWSLVPLALAFILWVDHLLRQAGRPALADYPTSSIVLPTVAAFSSATVGALLASHHRRHPVGWLLLLFGLFLVGNAEGKERGLVACQLCCAGECVVQYA